MNLDLKLSHHSLSNTFLETTIPLQETKQG